MPLSLLLTEVPGHETHDVILHRLQTTGSQVLGRRLSVFVAIDRSVSLILDFTQDYTTQFGLVVQNHQNS